MQKDQRGLRKNVAEDGLFAYRSHDFSCRSAKDINKNLSTGWINIYIKSYDSVDHLWLREMFTIHRFQE